MLINSANLMGGSTEPNNFRGFGRVHLEAGLPLGSNDSLVLFVAEASLESNGQTKYAFELDGEAGLDLRASLSWLDIPTTALSSVQLQHDLDLSVTSPSGDVYTMWTSGAKDTVNVNERVIVPTGSCMDGIYTVTVSAEELLTESQAYSLVVTGAILAADGM